jgi:hypothetical protein
VLNFSLLNQINFLNVGYLKFIIAFSLSILLYAGCGSKTEQQRQPGITKPQLPVTRITANQTQTAGEAETKERMS